MQPERNTMRKLLMLLSIILPVLACSLSSSAEPNTPIPPTIAPAALSSGIPVVGINPVIGVPGSRITVTATGFPAGASVNLFLSLANAASTTPIQTLPLNQSGSLSFGLEIPAQLGNVALTNKTVLIFTMAAVNGGPNASALFLVTGSGLATSSAPVVTAATGGTGGSTGGGFYIITPGSGVAVPGSAVVVTGSTTVTNPITVQLLDANNNLLGSAVASINTAAGTPYAWQTTISFAAPAAPTNGYVSASNGLQSTSVSIVLNGVTNVQQPTPQFAPTVGQGGFFPITTATPLIFGQ